MGVKGVLQPWAHLGPLGSFNMKQPACLGELGGKLLPYFGNKRLWGAEGKGSTSLVFIFHLKLVRRRRKKEKIKADVLP